MPMPSPMLRSRLRVEAHAQPPVDACCTAFARYTSYSGTPRTIGSRRAGHSHAGARDARVERELSRVGAEVRCEDRVCVSGVIFPAEFVEGMFRGRDVGYGGVPEREHLRECERFHEGELPIGQSEGWCAAPSL